MHLNGKLLLKYYSKHVTAQWTTHTSVGPNVTWNPTKEYFEACTKTKDVLVLYILTLTDHLSKLLLFPDVVLTLQFPKGWCKSKSDCK